MNTIDSTITARRKTLRRIIMALLFLGAAAVLGLLVRALVTVSQVPL